MAEFPSAPYQTISSVTTPTNVKRKTWRYAKGDAAKLFFVMRPEKPRQDSAIGGLGGVVGGHGQIPSSPIAARGKDHHRGSAISIFSEPAERQKKCHDREIIHHDDGEKHTDYTAPCTATSTTSSCRKHVPMPVHVTSLFTVHADELDVDSDQSDCPTGPRLSRPFFMPTPVLNKKRGSALISRRSVASVELSLKSRRRRTQDSDTLSPTCLSPSELQRLYVEECIPQRSSFRGDQEAQPAMPAKRVDDASQMLAESKERLYRAKKDLYIREEHCREIEVRATSMKYGMEEAMRKYTATSKELTSLKTFQWECSLSIPAQVLSMRQRKVHGELKLQIRNLESNLHTTMGELRSQARKWKEAQIALATCTQDVEKQKSIVADKTEQMRIAGGGGGGADAEMVAANKKAHRLSQHLISEVEAECAECRSKIQRMKRASVTPDSDTSGGSDDTSGGRDTSSDNSILQEELLMAKRELRDREELLGVVKRTNADLARKIADMEHKLGGRC